MNLLPRRPFTVLGALGTAAHHTFEVRAGVGLVFEPFIGRRGAVAMWSGSLPAWALAGWFAEGEQIARLKTGIEDALANRHRLSDRLAQRPLPRTRAEAFARTHLPMDLPDAVEASRSPCE